MLRVALATHSPGFVLTLRASGAHDDLGTEMTRPPNGRLPIYFLTPFTSRNYPRSPKLIIIMKYSFSVLYLIPVAILVLCFASCTKEVLVDSAISINTSIEQRSSTIELPVSKVTYSVVSGEMLVNFQASVDFSQAVLENTQYLKFLDSSGNESTLTFQTSAYTGDVGLLETTFEVGANSLTGLTLMEIQEIVIEDETIE